MITVQELIDKLNALPDKNQEIYCKDLWEASYKEIEDVVIDNDNEPIITINV